VHDAGIVESRSREKMKKPRQKKKKKASRKKNRPVAQPQAAAVAETAKPIPEKAAEQPGPPQPTLKREPDRKKPERKSPARYIGVVAQFLREARMELKKVKWPTRKELLASTAMVLFLVIIVSFFLGLVDFGLIKIIKNIVG
jgi:preprotein translocase subunit SecE